MKIQNLFSKTFLGQNRRKIKFLCWKLKYLSTGFPVKSSFGNLSSILELLYHCNIFHKNKKHFIQMLINIILPLSVTTMVLIRYLEINFKNERTFYFNKIYLILNKIKIAYFKKSSKSLSLFCPDKSLK